MVKRILIIMSIVWSVSSICAMEADEQTITSYHVTDDDIANLIDYAHAYQNQSWETFAEMRELLFEKNEDKKTTIKQKETIEKSFALFDYCTKNSSYGEHYKKALVYTMFEEYGKIFGIRPTGVALGIIERCKKINDQSFLFS